MKAIWNPRMEPGIHDEARLQPYEGGAAGGDVQYYDFKTHPELIPDVLEDYRPWKKHQAIQTFFDYLKWINGNTSILETNDCAFRFYNNRAPKMAAGRVMVYFR